MFLRLSKVIAPLFAAAGATGAAVGLAFFVMGVIGVVHMVSTDFPNPMVGVVLAAGGLGLAAVSAFVGGLAASVTRAQRWSTLASSPTKGD